MADTFEEARTDLIDLQAQRYKAGSGLQSHYHRDRGLLVIPVMGAAGTAPVVARVHAPIGYREVDFEYAKQGSPPLMPAAADSHTGDTILTEDHWFPAPSLDTEGQVVYGVRGHFVYVQPLGGRGPDDTFPIDGHPFVTGVDAIPDRRFVVPPRLVTPNLIGDRLVAAVVDGMWNREVVDSRMLSAYRIIG